MLQTVLVLLILLPIIGLIIGLIQPRLVIPKKFHPSRKKVFLIYFSLFFAAFIFMGVLSDNKEFTLNWYKDEKRMKISHEQIFKKLDRRATIQFSPELELKNPGFGERQVTLEKTCYSINVKKRYDEVLSIGMQYNNIFFDGKSPRCADTLADTLIFFNNVFGDNTNYDAAIKGVDEVLAKAQQTGESQRVEKIVAGKIVSIALHPNIGIFSIDISAE